MKKTFLFMLLAVLCLLTACDTEADPGVQGWSAGFGAVELKLPKDPQEPLYIAGYHNGYQITGVRDLQQARALWLDDGAESLLLISIDCVGLDSGTVTAIREKLEPFCRRTGCGSVHVVATHTHAGVDTLGLWGPVAINGKNSEFMQILINGAAEAAEAAWGSRCPGSLHWSVTKTEQLQEDSRDPQVYDPDLYQLRFAPEDSRRSGIRLISFAAHAEALRSENTMVSRDYPGVVCDLVKAETGDDALFAPGAIGGLILTPRMAEDTRENLELTGRRIANRVLAAREGTALEPKIQTVREEFETRLDNTLFQYYKFLGILNNSVRQDLAGAYWVKTELNLIQLGELTLALLPGEVFPELVSGTNDPQDPPALAELAQRHGIEDLMIVGLANDELGYILPPSQFVLHPEFPYVQEAEGDHYEETNSPGPECAWDLADAFAVALKKLER